jgi:hypothetical protein
MHSWVDLNRSRRSACRNEIVLSAADGRRGEDPYVRADSFGCVFDQELDADFCSSSSNLRLGE